ncbi:MULTISPECIES: substrate-binding domain-containing protein [Brenneria]|uniref:ABC transporter substrate-binding protein n=1 Tax=Brenneria nigrifluens DSM 30175 = ATCC 13028 TaxID=1121120 RepID=A0A2U1UFU2_9GAMM|nr:MULTISPECIES: substrate-binding domain-containing protein [Brenneria]EHD20874.1 periplasmic binding protein/LacI transcriptional regulator [Brenneria sp. EniD312]PWC20539.1 ABC transporter substrate-binding protein [Brenneria nigrifluens DSM 30175 = ATCC 13028]QCR04038.1 ABC transporter substrate-binding protein [Brenneria nigrifluens DSM 30175 = ATCC 13028]
MKKVLAGLLLAAAAVTVSAHAEDKIKVGFANRTLNGAFFNGLTEYMKIHAKERGYDLITTDARGDLTKQISDVEDMISQGINYLVLNPQDPEAGLRITQIAKRAGIPTVILDSDISLDAPVITRVQANNARNNIAIGEYAVEQFGNKPMNCVLISGNQGNLVGEARRSNFIRGVMEAQLRKYNQTNLTIVSQGWGNWDQQGGLKAMEDIVVAHGSKINCVYSEMDDMALGAILSLKGANKLQEVKVFAHDGYKRGLEAVERGDLQATAANNPNTLTATVLDIIAKYQAGNKEFPDYVYTPTVLITKDNVKKVYDPESLF